MTSFRRFAAFWAPPRGSALARFGAAWLGWDADAGSAVPHPDIAGLPMPVEAITATPRRYGLHATLKPPFRLAEGTAFSDLDAAARALASATAPFEAPPLALSRIGRFAALVPSTPCPALDRLAAGAVTWLDGFRAPPAEAELARRRAAGLTSRQEAYLTRWGYPYVLDEFRFHLTLTGGLPPETIGAVIDTLASMTAPFLSAPLPVSELCLFGEDGEGRFHLIRRYALTG